MKRLLLLIPLFLFHASEAQTSVYHPLPDSNAFWNFDFTVSWGITYGDYSVTISGDTTINSLTYHKLSTPFINSTPSGIMTGLITGYKGAFRQEVPNKKVFFIPPSDSVEQLLYDFSMQVGDTVHGYLENHFGNFDIVQSIDSVLVGSSFHKRFNINPFYNIQLIEGVGSNYGLTEFSPGSSTDQNTFVLTCFTVNGSTVYPDTITACSLINNLDDIDRNAVTLSVFPNPFHLTSFIRLNDAFQNSELNIYNSLGEIVRTENIDYRSEFTLNRDHLIDGIYFIRLKNENGKIVTGKFIVD